MSGRTDFDIRELRRRLAAGEWRASGNAPGKPAAGAGGEGSDDPQPPPGDDGREAMWRSFLSHAEQGRAASRRNAKINCRIDRDIVEELDRLDTGGAGHTVLLNALARAFLAAFRPRAERPRRKEDGGGGT